MTQNTRITDESYDRDARTYEFDFGDTGFEYAVGDVLSVHSNNDSERVAEVLDLLRINPNDCL